MSFLRKIYYSFHPLITVRQAIYV